MVTKLKCIATRRLETSFFPARAMFIDIVVKKVISEFMNRKHRTSSEFITPIEPIYLLCVIDVLLFLICFVLTICMKLMISYRKTNDNRVRT